MLTRIGELRTKAQNRINLGCGEASQDGCINVDLYGRPDITADARKLPFPDSSVDWLECHHMLEHFTLKDGLKVMAEWARVIKPEGTLLVTVPDIIAIQGYMMVAKDIPEMWTGLNMFIYGQDGEGMRHLSAYCTGFLTYRLKEKGFECETFNWPFRPTPSFGVLACKSSASR